MHELERVEELWELQRVWQLDGAPEGDEVFDRGQGGEREIVDGVLLLELDPVQVLGLRWHGHFLPEEVS